ncbi:MAG: metalloregulator ArsR/SmtB family transcription factor [Nitrososphaerales archaeon]|nr:metalloregulator ArsR/SmtB family transcription factor [Nitrososphaerales archaeon]
MTLETLTPKPHALFFQALANPSRMRILNLLRERGGMNVTQICSKLGLEQTHVSHNLRCLEFCGLVTASREGKSRIYSINEQTMLPLLEIVDEHLKKYASNLLTCDALER